MSRPNGKKKFACIVNCLPVKGRLGKHTANSKQNARSSDDLGTGGSMENSFAMGGEERMNHTRQWIQNLSTLASYDPGSILEDPEATMLEKEDEKKKCCCCHEDDSKSVNECDESGSPCDIKKKYCDNSFDSNANGPSDRKNNADDSYASGMKKFDDSSMMSSRFYDNSALSSKCCSQHPKGRRRRCRSTSTLQNPETSSMLSEFSMASLATELVTLNMNAGKNLGITIVGHTNKQGDNGIYVGCVKKGGAAEMSKRVEPGDLILEVNGIDLEHLSNGEALSVLKSEVGKGGNVQILLAKYWDLDPDSKEDNNFCQREMLYEPAGSVHMSTAGSDRNGIRSRDGSLQRSNVLRPIFEENRPRMYNEASGLEIDKLNTMKNCQMVFQPQGVMFQQPSNNFNTIPPNNFNNLPTMSSTSAHTNYPDSGYHEARKPPSASSMHALPPYPGSSIDRRMKAIRNGSQQSIANGSHVDINGTSSSKPFRGSELVDWIQKQMSGLSERKDAQKYAMSLMKSGYIFNADVRQGSLFHEQCLYVFGNNSDHRLPPMLWSPDSNRDRNSLDKCIFC